MTDSTQSRACPLCDGLHDASEACVSPTLRRVGTVVGDRYQILSLLGEGGMGVVYEAKHTFVGRRFAVKFLRAEFAQKLDMLERFQREAKAAGALESEHIAAVTDFGVDEQGAPYLVMEYLAGEDLSRLVAHHGRLAVSRAAGLIVQACRGLVVAHAHGLIHRDLKPANLFILRRADGTDLLKIIDFGIAKLKNAAQSSPSNTKTGATMGTPYYMPPEQARGQRDLDHRADIYALGAILYEMLSGAKPHPGDNYNEILFDILNRPPTPLASLRSGLPAGLCTAVERAMAFEPADRFSSMAELGQALSPFAASTVRPEEVFAQPIVSMEANARTLPTPVTGDMRAVSPGPEPGSGAKAGGDRDAQSTVIPFLNRRGRALVFAIGLALAIGLCLWLAWPRTKAPGSGAPADPVIPAHPAPTAPHPEPTSSLPVPQPPPATQPSPAPTIAPKTVQTEAIPEARRVWRSPRRGKSVKPSERTQAKSSPDLVEIDATNPYGNK